MRGDRRRDLRPPRLDERRARLHLHRLFERHLQHDRHVDLIADRERQVRVRRREAGELNRKMIITDWQVQQPEATAFVADAAPYLIGIVIPNRHRRARHDGFARIAHRPGDVG